MPGDGRERVIGRRALLAGGAVGGAYALVRVAGAGAWALLGADGERMSIARPIADDGPPAPPFSQVTGVTPEEGLRFLAGLHPRYPAASLDSLSGFSPAVILESCDTTTLDQIAARQGSAAVSRAHLIVARGLLDALLAVYGSAPVLLALDAGHGGKQGVFFDPGSAGTEYQHNRAVVLAAEEIAREPAYSSITIRRIFDDGVGDDFGLPAPEDRKSAASLVMRNVRASMLAQEAATWNTVHPDAQVAVHVVSVHFNAGSGGTLVLHQGSSAPASYRELSVAFGRAYAGPVNRALNASGLMPAAQRLVFGTGLSDDTVLYEPTLRGSRINPYTGRDRSDFPRRYAMLQTSLLQSDYAEGALRYHGLL